MTHEGEGSFFEVSGDNRQPPVLRRRPRWPIFFVVLLLAALAPLAFFGWADFYRNVIEHKAPEVEFGEIPVGIGREDVGIHFRVRDAHSGIRTIIVRAEQNGKLTDLFQADYLDSRVFEQAVAVVFKGQQKGLEEGSARIIVTAIDRSRWANKTAHSFDLPVDYNSPKLSLVPAEHNVALGGMGLVFYRVADANKTFHGVRIGVSPLYPGFPARALDADFRAIEDLYFAFFALPLDYSAQSSDVQVFAQDSMGNYSSKKLEVRVEPRASAPKKFHDLSPEYVISVVDPLYAKYQQAVARIDLEEPGNVAKADSPEELARRFRVVNEQYRELIESSIQTFFSRPLGERYWSGAFIPMQSKNREIDFGTLIEYQFENFDAGSYVSSGMRSVFAGQSPVRAANNGIVIYADDLGVYGQSVIVDHGFGLASLYAHLSSSLRKEGDRVKKGEPLGYTGSSGLVSSESLQFEMRFYGIPIDPAPWTNAKWVSSQVENRILRTKRQMGIQVKRFLN